MPNYLKQIFHTQFFGVLNIIFGFGTLYLLIRYLQVQEYGEYVLIQGFIAIGGLVFSQNIYSYTRLRIPGAEKEKQYAYLKTVLLIVLVPYLTIMILLYVLDIKDYIWSFFEINTKLGLLTLYMLCFELINLEFMRFFIGVKKINLKNYAQFMQKVLVLAGTLVLVYVDSLSIVNFLYLYLFGQLSVLFFFIMSIEDIKKLLYSDFMVDVLQKGYKVALPLLPIGLMSIALNYTDTLMIAKFVDKESVAQYGFASQIISIAMMMIGSSVILTLFPYATEAQNKSDIEQRNQYFFKMLKYALFLSLLFYAFVLLGSNAMINFLNLEKYNNVPKYLFILGAFPFFQVIYSVSSHHLQILQIFKIQIYIALFVMIFNIVLNYYFIQNYGAIGAAYASLIAFIMLAIIYSFLSILYDKNIFSKEMN